MKLFLVGLAITSSSLIVAAARQPAPSTAQKSPSAGAVCPMHDMLMKGDDHAKMNARGEAGMGFSQTATTHHFLLKPDGGVIQVEANDPQDTAARDEIRVHLRHITHAFATGDFDIPMFVHDTIPPGVPEMKRLAAKITYTLEQTPNGGSVRIHSDDAAAVNAIQQFLRFQIVEHQNKNPISLP
jgi:hypothetical protein